MAADTSECRIALVEDSGGASIVVTAEGSKAPLENGKPLALGDLLSTGSDAWVDLRLCDGSVLRIGENSRFYFEGVTGDSEDLLSWAFRLVQGSVYAAVTGTNSGQRVKLRVRTVSAALGVRGTEFVVDTDAEKATTLHTFGGEVLMGGAGDFDKLSELHGAELTAKFEAVGKEQVSSIHRGEMRPARAASFKIGEFRNARKAFFGRALKKSSPSELRAKFGGAHRRFLDDRAKRGLFERSRGKLEEHLDKKPRTGAPQVRQSQELNERRLKRQKKLAGSAEMRKQRNEKIQPRKWQRARERGR